MELLEITLLSTEVTKEYLKTRIVDPFILIALLLIGIVLGSIAKLETTLLTQYLPNDAEDYFYRKTLRSYKCQN